MTEIGHPLTLIRTIFFWAPIAKWGLVAAGLKDLARPAEKLSVSQNVALAATGFIWVRPRIPLHSMRVVQGLTKEMGSGCWDGPIWTVMLGTGAA